MTDVDILVVGGGPAGLLAASNLAPAHRVALIERAVLGRTTKYWVTTDRRLRKHGLSDCVLRRPPAMVVGTFLGGRVVAPGDLSVVDENRFLHVLLDRCRERKVILSEHCSLLNLNWAGGRVIATTETDTYRARLVVDASGTGSPIAETFRLHQLDGFLSVHGAHLRHIRLNTQDVILAFANLLGNPPPIFEVIPTGEESAYCTVFTYARDLVPPHSLDAIFRHQCRHNPFFDLTAESKIEHGKAGAIAIGRQRRRQLVGVISIGEAGLVQPPLLGSAFNEILEHCEGLCAHMARLLTTTTAAPTTPNYLYPLMKRVQDRMQLSLARMLLKGNVETFDHLIRFMCTLPPGVAYDFCSNELNWGQLCSSAFRFAWHRSTQWRPKPSVLMY